MDTRASEKREKLLNDSIEIVARAVTNTIKYSTNADFPQKCYQYFQTNNNNELYSRLNSNLWKIALNCHGVQRPLCTYDGYSTGGNKADSDTVGSELSFNPSKRGDKEETSVKEQDFFHQGASHYIRAITDPSVSDVVYNRTMALLSLTFYTEVEDSYLQEIKESTEVSFYPEDSISPDSAKSLVDYNRKRNADEENAGEFYDSDNETEVQEVPQASCNWFQDVLNEE